MIGYYAILGAMFLAIGGIVGLVCWLVWYMLIEPHTSYYGMADTVMLGISMLLVLSIGWGGTVSINRAIIRSQRANEQITYTTTAAPIYSLANQTSIEGAVYGTFAFGRGYVGSEMYIFYMVEDDGATHIDKVKVSEARFVVTDEAPRVEIRTGVLENWWLRCAGYFVPTQYTFYVPENTMQYDFNVDLTQ